ncbi:hypothetical protein [Mesorhizobium sp. M1E.F.Ca.ET.041.01.1.1]|uniref:hypothetical protein n=1 Tax=Mesorhizobium sp. M1E.F.Ca.ET.041.01.1.1 TaxID=2496759 RepID=UPI000FC9FAF9|nr:hypothetical protein [Mesorhizobium sp. M1E.F.Ca.ET.041.01.1.1]RUW37814.1 hypothetical protein EOA38_03005 [Mesorhizobium sp. M1E.F.Ca.ET.041.01.1.1]
MQQILERLAAKITQADTDQQSSGSLRIEEMFDPDIVPHIPGDDVHPFIGHPDAMFPDGGGPTEKIAKLQKPEDRLLWSGIRETHHKAQIKVRDIPNILDDFEHSVKVLSLE